MNFTYKVRLKREPEGGFTVTVPALPGCVTYGDNEEHALLMAREAIEGYIAVLRENGEEIPTDDNTSEYSVSVSQ